jgi:hypothetical protein
VLGNSYICVEACFNVRQSSFEAERPSLPRDAGTSVRKMSALYHRCSRPAGSAAGIENRIIEEATRDHFDKVAVGFCVRTP